MIEQNFYIFKPVRACISVEIKYNKRIVPLGTKYYLDYGKLVHGRFSWQEGYGAFSYSKSQLPRAINYIKNQQRHHQKQSFKEEYQKILEKFEVDFEEQYIFTEIE